MFHLVPSLRCWVAIVALLSGTSSIAAQSPAPRAAGSSHADKSELRTQILSTIPAAMYEKWRKYGQWDYKQIGFSYRDYTQFNFGATAAAAKIDKDLTVALVQAFKPNPSDIQSLAESGLEANFQRNAAEFEKLLKMAEQDIGVNRIAPDFTWLDGSSKWPRENLGFSNTRWDEYRSLFKSLSLTEGIVRTLDFPKSVFFLARSYGLCTGGSSAGYVYSATPLAPVTASPSEALDAEARKNASKHYAYVFKPLKPNWYMFYEVDW